MNKKLLPFQEVGAFNLANNFHHLLADVPGLGKTVQAISAVERLGLKRVLVVCPASVRTRWQEEITECHGANNLGAAWEIVSYAGAMKFAQSTTQRSWDAIILDEAHFLKTVESQRTKAVFDNKIGLARRASYIWPLTGTPVLNRPRELYPILKTLHPDFADMKFAAFAQRYCGAYWDGYAMNTKGATNVDELAGLLAPFITRRTKQDAFPGRREPMVSLVPVEVSGADLAAVRDEEAMIQDRESYLSPAAENFSQLGDLSRLLRLTGEAKVRAAAEYVEDLLETVDKVVVFFHHTEVGRRLNERLCERGYQPVVYQGGMSDSQKDAQKLLFTSSRDCRVFLGQIQAAGTGVDGLQKVCSDVVFAEQSWVPGEMGQAIDRLDRMGQAADFVTARVLHAPGTLESAVLGARRGKEAVIDRLLGPRPVTVGQALAANAMGMWL